MQFDLRQNSVREHALSHSSGVEVTQLFEANPVVPHILSAIHSHCAGYPSHHARTFAPDVTTCAFFIRQESPDSPAILEIWHPPVTRHSMGVHVDTCRIDLNTGAIAGIGQPHQVLASETVQRLKDALQASDSGSFSELKIPA